MRQNIYDDPRFFEGYRKLKDGDTGLNGAMEAPAIAALLPDLTGRDVLDLGCGFGDFCRAARAQGAAKVVGVDLSRKMVTVARQRTRDPHIEYVNAAIEDFVVAPEAYGCVVSRLALHYVSAYEPVVEAVYRGLRSGGSFVMSGEHPVCTSSCGQWVEAGNGGSRHWPVDRYWEEGERRQHWFVDGVIKYHRTVQTYVDVILPAGFRLTRLLEPYPSRETLQARPDLKDSVKRPAVLVIAAKKS